jgi:hypothetical protein
MTTPAITISFKVPPQIAERIPRAGNGRSKFIVQALAEKIARQRRAEWKPTGRRGHKLAALLAKGKGERLPLLNELELARELAARRGRLF